jgi:hypothetical protein
LGLLFGLSLVVAALLAFYVARPRGGEVVRFLRNDHAQSYYVAVTIGVFAIGAMSIVAGLTGLDPLGGFEY